MIPASLCEYLQPFLCHTVAQRCAICIFLKPLINNYLLLMSDTDKITDNFTFLYFKKTFLTCGLCAPEGQKG